MFLIMLLNNLMAINIHFAFAASHPLYYRVKVPVSSLSCAQEAEALGKRYTTMTHKVAIKVECTGTATIVDGKTEYPLYILDMTYSGTDLQAKDQIKSTYYGNTVIEPYTGNHFGMYKTMSDCLNDLPARTSEYQKYTQLPILASTCEKATDTTIKTFITRIDTVGFSKIHLFSVDDKTSLYQDETFKSVVEKLIKLNKGTVVAHANYFYFYFGEHYITPLETRFGVMSTTACQEQLVDLKNILNKKHLINMIYGCTPKFLSIPELNVLKGVADQIVIYKSYTEKELYNDFNECNRDKTRMISRSKDQGYKVTGAICRLNDDYTDDVNSLYIMDLYD